MMSMNGQNGKGGTTELDTMYREVVLDHHRNPRGGEALESADVEADGLNPSCGDEVKLQLAIEGDRVARAAVVTSGCAVSRASGSMLAEAIEGASLERVRELTEVFKAMMHGEDPPEHIDLGDIEALAGVQKFPVRIKCALLPWVTLLDALEAQLAGENAAAPSTTEGEGVPA